MNRNIINIVLSFIFSITLTLVIFCLTLLNNHFIIREFEKKDYYGEIYNNLKKADIEIEYSKNDVIKDINKYIKEYFPYDYESSLKGDKISLKKYNSAIRFFDYNFIYIKIVSYVITLVLVIITGNILLKTKKYHDINIVFVIASLMTVLLYGIIYIFVNVDDMIINNLISEANHYLLGIAVILLEIGLYNQIKTRLNK